MYKFQWSIVIPIEAGGAGYLKATDNTNHNCRSFHLGHIFLEIELFLTMYSHNFQVLTSGHNLTIMITKVVSKPMFKIKREKSHDLWVCESVHAGSGQRREWT